MKLKSTNGKGVWLVGVGQKYMWCVYFLHVPLTC